MASQVADPPGSARSKSDRSIGCPRTHATGSVRAVSFGRSARIITIVALMILWYAVGTAVTGSAVNTVLTSLTLMLYPLVPWTAANLVDYFFVRRAHYAIADLFTPGGISGRWGRNGLIAYGVGVLAEIPFLVLSDIGGTSFHAPIAIQISDVDISWVVGLIISGMVYWLLSRSTNVAAELEAARREHDGADTEIT